MEEFVTLYEEGRQLHSSFHLVMGYHAWVFHILENKTITTVQYFCSFLTEFHSSIFLFKIVVWRLRCQEVVLG